MSESKGAMIAKTVQKHAGRAKEKFLQNLGKVDRTLDDIFEEHLQNFNRQHQQATRLQKEFNNYIRCIRAVQTASKSLMEAITEVYESGWSGHDLLYVQAQNLEMLWQDFSHKLGDQVLIPMNTYTNQFPEVRKKIEKRGRKLVDYDSQRHSFQNLQSNAAKRRDDVKVTRGREQLEEAKRTYEVLNSELHDELPALFDSRVLFYVNNLQTLFSSEQLFHSESNKVYAELEAITDKLATDSQRTSYKKPASVSAGGTLPSPAHNNVAAHTNGNSNTVQTPPSSPVPAPATPTTPVTPVPSTPVSSTPVAPATPPPTEAKLNGTTTPPSTPDSDSPKDLPIKTEDVKDKSDKLDKSDVTEAPTAPARHDDKQENGKNNNEDKDEKKVQELYDIPAGSPVLVQESPNNNEEKRQVDVDTIEVERERKTNDASKGDETYDIPVGATLAGLPAGTLYRVRATYRYQREDDDELSFDVGDVIRVVEYDDPEEQEEGWLMGMKESSNEKGMFPANFTRPI